MLRELGGIEGIVQYLKRKETSSEEISDESLREMRKREEPESPSPGQKYKEQYEGKYRDFMLEMSSCRTQIIGRVKNKIPARTNRLKAIGNGQVPAVVGLAWEILNANL